MNNRILRLPKLGSYVPWVMSGNLLYLSGSYRSISESENSRCGGRERTLEEGRGEKPRWCRWPHKSMGSRLVKRIVFVSGFVWGVEGFSDSPKVINGASDLFGEIFGESGRHARAAVAVAGLPGGATVEIQTVVEFDV